MPSSVHSRRSLGALCLCITLLALSGCGASASYSLRATVRNLNEAGLTLYVNGQRQSVSSGATGQTLPPDLPAGADYAVGIASQPAHEICSLANGTGTMPVGGATVQITCAADTFTVGGTLRGLTGSGLVLLDNGTDATTITAGATHFVLPSALAYGTTYALTIGTQPTGQTCTVANGSGTIDSANVTTVAVSCQTNTYAVSGTITGLTSTGLVLLDNGTDATAIGANASQYTMPTPIAYGATYDIQIGTQPVGLTCSVAQGSGTMGLGGATVNIVCTANQYTVGGTISGLGTSGLVLLDNGADAITVPANASQFTMPTAVAYGSGYSITVQTQPSTLVCSVANGSGTMGVANVTDVAITCVPNTQILYFFQGGTDGSAPQAPLLLAADGNFYGTTYGGGSSNNGTVFEISPAGTESVVFTFSSGNGSRPQAGLVQNAAGDLLGTTSNGGVYTFGTAFKLTTAGVETVLHSFAKYGDGAYPIGTPVIDSSGDLFGTTWGGGLTHGTVWEVFAAGTQQTLYSFANNSTDGGYPTAGMVLASDGNFYGTTSNGGPSASGTVFKITPTGTETMLYAFTGGTDGGDPDGALIQGSNGNFYGTTRLGGAHGDGTVFEMTPSGTETVLYSFAGGTSDGANPTAGLLLARDGNFYGTTSAGGPANLGTIFELTPNGVETVLHDFAGGATDGADPSANLIQGSNGKLYGTTQSGGPNGYGTVFVVTPP